MALGQPGCAAVRGGFSSSWGVNRFLPVLALRGAAARGGPRTSWWWRNAVSPTIGGISATIGGRWSRWASTSPPATPNAGAAVTLLAGGRLLRDRQPDRGPPWPATGSGPSAAGRTARTGRPGRAAAPQGDEAGSSPRGRGRAGRRRPVRHPAAPARRPALGATGGFRPGVRAAVPDVGAALPELLPTGPTSAWPKVTSACWWAWPESATPARRC